MRAVSAAPPDDPNLPSGEESISASAERARAELHAEIERVRRGVEQMLDEQQAPLNSDLRRELDTMQDDLRRCYQRRGQQQDGQCGFGSGANPLRGRTSLLQERHVMSRTDTPNSAHDSPEDKRSRE